MITLNYGRIPALRGSIRQTSGQNGKILLSYTELITLNLFSSPILEAYFPDEMRLCYNQRQIGKYKAIFVYTTQHKKIASITVKNHQPAMHSQKRSGTCNYLNKIEKYNQSFMLDSS